MKSHIKTAVILLSRNSAPRPSIYDALPSDAQSLVAHCIKTSHDS